MKRPSINTHRVNSLTGPGERAGEVFWPATEHEAAGCLISATRASNGTPMLDVYRCDPQIRVRVDWANLSPTGFSNDQLDRALAVLDGGLDRRELDARDTEIRNARRKTMHAAILTAIMEDPTEAVTNILGAAAVEALTMPPCLAGMGCLCAGHARGNPVDAPCDTREGEDCDECGAFIPSTERNGVNASHDESCSLHPSNSVEPAAVEWASPGDPRYPSTGVQRTPEGARVSNIVHKKINIAITVGVPFGTAIGDRVERLLAYGTIREAFSDAGMPIAEAKLYETALDDDDACAIWNALCVADKYARGDKAKATAKAGVDTAVRLGIPFKPDGVK